MKTASYIGRGTTTWLRIHWSRICTNWRAAVKMASKGRLRTCSILALGVISVSPANASSSGVTLPILLKSFLISENQAPQIWGVAANIVRWEKPSLIEPDPTPRLFQKGTTKVRLFKKFWDAEIYMVGPTGYPEEIVISINDPRLDPDHSIIYFDFSKAMKEAGFRLEKSCIADRPLVSFGTSVYVARAAGYQPISLNYSWEGPNATHGSAISITLAFTESVAKTFSCN